MGKVEDMRALREQLRAAAALPAARKVKGLAPARVILDELAPAEELCGHRSIGNKSCIRPSNHSEKNHRYAKS